MISLFTFFLFHFFVLSKNTKNTQNYQKVSPAWFDLTWDWGYLQGCCCGPTEILKVKIIKTPSLFVSFVWNLLCGDIEGSLATRAQWYLSALEACLAKKVSHSLPNHFHLQWIGKRGSWPLTASPHQGRCSNSSQPALSPWANLHKSHNIATIIIFILAIYYLCHLSL